MAHQNDFVDILARQAKSLLAHAPHRNAVGEHPDALQGEALCAAQRFVHRGRVLRLYADDFHARIQRFRVCRDARNQPAAADRHENGIDFIAMALPQDFHGNRALAGNDIRIVEWVHEYQISLAAEFGRMS